MIALKSFGGTGGGKRYASRIWKFCRRLPPSSVSGIKQTQAKQP
jgi:hypothetical protein